jgi:hypothetical protein
VPKSHEGGDRYRCKGTFDPSGKTYQAGTVRTLPPSTIYGFKGTFPGPRINAEYGKPVIVRFEKQPVSGAYFVLSHDAVYCLSPAHCVAPDLVDACSNGGSPTFRGDNCRW